MPPCSKPSARRRPLPTSEATGARKKWERGSRQELARIDRSPVRAATAAMFCSANHASEGGAGLSLCSIPRYVTLNSGSLMLDTLTLLPTLDEIHQAQKL